MIRETEMALDDGKKSEIEKKKENMENGISCKIKKSRKIRCSEKYHKTSK